MKMGTLSSTSVPLNGEVKKVSGIQVKVCPEVGETGATWDRGKVGHRGFLYVLIV